MMLGPRSASSGGRSGERGEDAARERGEDAARERGAVLLAALVLGTAAAAMSVAIVGAASVLAAETRARRDVLCARYAALGGLALGSPVADGAALVGDEVDALEVTRLRLGPAWCVLRASGRCGSATRTLERTEDDPALCDVVTAPVAPG